MRHESDVRFSRRALTLAVVAVTVGVMLTGCASSPSAVLEPEAAQAEAPEAQKAPPPQPGPAFEKLLAVLRTRGYDGVGLEYESDATLDLLTRVFSDARSGRRRIKLIYTGLSMQYDATHQSLTVGGTSDVQAILLFIQKHVPVSPK